MDAISATDITPEAWFEMTMAAQETKKEEIKAIKDKCKEIIKSAYDSWNRFTAANETFKSLGAPEKNGIYKKYMDQFIFSPIKTNYSMIKFNDIKSMMIEVGFSEKDIKFTFAATVKYGISADGGAGASATGGASAGAADAIKTRLPSFEAKKPIIKAEIEEPYIDVPDDGSTCAYSFFETAQTPNGKPNRPWVCPFKEKGNKCACTKLIPINEEVCPRFGKECFNLNSTPSTCTHRRQHW